jgi:hypothetical protein
MNVDQRYQTDFLEALSLPALLSVAKNHTAIDPVFSELVRRLELQKPVRSEQLGTGLDRLLGQGSSGMTQR